MSSIIFSSVLHSLISDDKIAEYYKRYSTKPVMDPPTWRLVKASLVAIIDDCRPKSGKPSHTKFFTVFHVRRLNPLIFHGTGQNLFYLTHFRPNIMSIHKKTGSVQFFPAKNEVS